jgi:protein ImuB
MHWLAIHLPELPLDALVGETDAEGTRQRTVVLDAGRAIAMTADCLTAGTHIGMSLAGISSAVPGVRALMRQPHREAALLQRLVLSLTRFSPWLVSRPTGVLLELSTTLRVLGGSLATVVRDVRKEAFDAGAKTVAFGDAATATASSIFASLDKHPEESKHTQQCDTRLGLSLHSRLALTRRRLDALPISTLESVWTAPTSLRDLLQGIGCNTLADLRALPRRGLTRRGGRAVLDLVARAYGDEPDPQTWFEPPARFELTLDLMHRADNAGALVFAAQRLVQPLTGWLAARWLAASRVSLELRHETSLRHDRHDRTHSTLDIALAEPSRDAKQIMLVLRERLQRMTLPAPVYSIVLRLDDAVAHEGRDSVLWANATTQGQSERMLIDRLGARLGCERVQRMQAVADHRPEHTTRLVPAASFPDLTSRDPPTRDAVIPTAPRPIWMLAEPMPLHESAGRLVHDGRPLTVISRAERIEAGWFDGRIVNRDYHVAVSDDGCWWIFRERRAGQPLRWFLHGIFG